MNTKEFNELDSYINDRLKEFKLEWPSKFSFMYIRFITEYIIKYTYNFIENKDKNEIKMIDRIKKIKKIINKKYPFFLIENIHESLDNLYNIWKQISNSAHAILGKRDLETKSKTKLELMMQNLLTNVYKFLNGFFLKKEYYEISMVNLDINILNGNDSIKKELHSQLELAQTNLMKASSQNNENIKTISKLESNLKKYKQIIQTKNVEFYSLEKIKEDVVNLALRTRTITDSWKFKIKANINKYDFLSIIYGNGKFRSIYDTINKLRGISKNTIDYNVILKWKEKQKNIDRIWEEVVTSIPNNTFDNEWAMNSELNLYISNNQNIRYYEEKNIHSVIIDVNDNTFESLRKYNFSFSLEWMRENYYWSLYSCWVKGIINIYPIVLNRKNGEYKLLEIINLNKHKKLFRDFDIMIENFLIEKVGKNE